MTLLNKLGDDEISMVLNLILLRYAVIIAGAAVLGVIAIVLLRVWVRRGNRISDRGRERVHATIEHRLSNRPGVRALAHTTWDAVARHTHRDDDQPPAVR